MSLWICQGCTAAYAVGALACPQCGGTDYVEDWKMPKITKADGLTLEPAPEPEAEPTVATATDTAPAVETEAEAAPAPAPAPKPAKG